MSDPDTELRRLAFNPTDAERLAGAQQTRESLDHTLRAYGNLERRNAALRRERKDAAAMLDWLLKEYVNAYSGIPVEWDQAQYDEACRIREQLEAIRGDDHDAR